MQRLRNLAHEALTWPHLGEKQRLVWASALELNVVPVQELGRGGFVWWWVVGESWSGPTGMQFASVCSLSIFGAVME